MKPKRVRIEQGISDDGYAYIVRASIGSGANRIESPEIRIPKTDTLDAMLPGLRAAWHRAKMKLRDEQHKAGGKAKRGTIAGDKSEYLRVAPDLSTQRRAERDQQITWWASQFPNRARRSLDPKEIRRAILTLTHPKTGRPLSASSRKKYLTALSQMFEVLDPGMPNPCDDVVKDTEPKAVNRDQPYELIDAIVAHLRDRGHGKAPSKSKARLRVLAYAPLTPAQLWALDRSRVDFVKGELLPEDRDKGEGAQANRKPLTADALDAFRAFDAAGCWGLKPSRSSLRKAFVRARNKAIAALRDTRPDLVARARTMRPYDLRHSFATEVVKATGGDLNAASAFLDHADLKTTRRYTGGAMPVVLQRAGDVVAAAFAARPRYSPPFLPTTDPNNTENIRKKANIVGRRGGEFSTPHRTKTAGNRRNS
jgi:integrase